MKTFSKETNRALVQMLSHGYILSPPENNSDYLVTDWSEVCTYADAHKCVLSYYFH